MNGDFNIVSRSRYITANFSAPNIWNEDLSNFQFIREKLTEIDGYKFSLEKIMKSLRSKQQVPGTGVPLFAFNFKIAEMYKNYADFFWVIWEFEPLKKTLAATE